MRQLKSVRGDRRILVVDDDPITAKVIRWHLRNAGYGVSVARDGVEALELVESGRFDLVVTDCNMPNMDGRSLVVRLRQMSDYRQTPIIFLTAKALELDIERLQEEFRLTEVLEKPFSPRLLVDSINRELRSGAISAPKGRQA